MPVLIEFGESANRQNMPVASRKSIIINDLQRNGKSATATLLPIRHNVLVLKDLENRQIGAYIIREKPLPFLGTTDFPNYRLSPRLSAIGGCQ